MSVKYRCNQCGVGKWEKPSRAKVIKFCSNTCYGLFRRKRAKKNCLICNKEFEIRPSEKRVKYCSKKCEVKSRTGLKRNLPYDWAKGENSYFWKGGINKLAHRIRNSVEYKIWRTGVFKRDDYKCVVGGRVHGNKLNADHVKPFSIILKENNIRTFQEAICCKELWDINNGQTLCIDCHKKTGTYLKNTKTLKQIYTNSLIV